MVDEQDLQVDIHINLKLWSLLRMQIIFPVKFLAITIYNTENCFTIKVQVCQVFFLNFGEFEMTSTEILQNR